VGVSTTTVIADAAGVATAAGVAFGAVQLLLSRTQARTSFEDEVAAQYRQIIKPRIAHGLLQPLEERDRETLQAYYEYFDLSNEQVFLRMQGRVRRRTWIEWGEGIESNLKREPISSAWQVVRDHLTEFRELRYLEHDFNGDPRAWNPRWRRILHRELPASDPRVEQRVLRTRSR